MDIQKQELSELYIHNTAFVLPFSTLDRDSLALAEGKGANLGEMANAGFLCHRASALPVLTLLSSFITPQSCIRTYVSSHI
jgi:hypothetical protein